MAEYALESGPSNGSRAVQILLAVRVSQSRRRDSDVDRVFGDAAGQDLFFAEDGVDILLSKRTNEELINTTRHLVRPMTGCSTAQLSGIESTSFRLSPTEFVEAVSPVSV